MKERYKKPDCIKELERLALEAKRKKYPDVPFLAPIIFEDKTANGLTRAIIAYIKLRGFQAERVNNYGRPVDNRKTYVNTIGMQRTIGNIEWVKGTGTDGSSDIHATIKPKNSKFGVSVKIEVKIGRDFQSLKQKQYQIEIEKAGGIYFLAKNFTSFFNWYNENFQ
ncbi:conserved hypothetical protein [uncultured Paludibacter sp.]|nr:conserved hypothetical protein [uncultured Paludibacter sp.]